MINSNDTDPIVMRGDGNFSIPGYMRAIKGRFNNITLTTRGLAASPFPYMGVMSFNDDSGEEQTTTLLEIYAN